MNINYRQIHNKTIILWQEEYDNFFIAIEPNCFDYDTFNKIMNSKVASLLNIKSDLKYLQAISEAHIRGTLIETDKEQYLNFMLTNPKRISKHYFPLTEDIIHDNLC
jgi:hypothetical protein